MWAVVVIPLHKAETVIICIRGDESSVRIDLIFQEVLVVAKRSESRGYARYPQASGKSEVVVRVYGSFRVKMDRKCSNVSENWVHGRDFAFVTLKKCTFIPSIYYEQQSSNHARLSRG